MIKTINLSLTNELLLTIDQAAAKLYSSRSEYVRHAIIEQLRVDAGQGNRRKTTKNLPRSMILPSENDEYDIAPEYFDD